MRFSLLSMLEFTAICGMLVALAPLLGITAVAALVLMAGSLWLRCGPAALLMWMAASIAADIPGSTLATDSGTVPQLLSLLLGCGLVFWYRARHASPA